MRVLLAFLLAAQPAVAGPVPLALTRARVPGARLAWRTPVTAPALPKPAALSAGPKAALSARLLSAGAVVLADAELLSRTPSAEASRALAESHVSLLLGEPPAARSVLAGAPVSERPRGLLGPRSAWRGLRRALSPPPVTADPEKARAVRRMRLGTAAFKVGMEVVRVGVPLMVGGATGVALLAVTYGVSQAGFGSLTGALTDRFPASKVLAGTFAFQAVLIGAAAALGAAGLFSPALLFPLYGLIGAAMGVAETARKTVPSLLLVQEGEEALNKYNGSIHVCYQVAGVAGAALIGVLIGALRPLGEAGPLAAMAVVPPVYALAALLFWKVRHPFERARPRGGEGGLRRRAAAALKAYAADLKEGVRALRGPGLGWLAAAMVLPQLVHRVFEDMLLPVYAKGILGDKAASAWMMTSSNLGELVGALVLLKLAERFKGPSAWVRWSALGLLLGWALVLSHSLPALLPVILVFSLTWAASDLSLLSALQTRVPRESVPRALGVLAGLVSLLGVAVSLLLGRFMDSVPLPQAVAWVAGGFSAVSVLVWLASRRLKK